MLYLTPTIPDPDYSGLFQPEPDYSVGLQISQYLFLLPITVDLTQRDSDHSLFVQTKASLCNQGKPTARAAVARRSPYLAAEAAHNNLN